MIVLHVYILLIIQILLLCINLTSAACTVACSAGKYCSSTTCQSCTAGYYCTGTNATAVANTGRTPCTAGTWSGASATSSTVCTAALCGDGYYCSDGVKTVCPSGTGVAAGSGTSASSCTVVCGTSGMILSLLSLSLYLLCSLSLLSLETCTCPSFLVAEIIISYDTGATFLKVSSYH